jgi:magnesium transporter
MTEETEVVARQEADEDEVFGLPDRLVPEVRAAIAAGDAAALDAMLSPLHPADVADLIEQLDPRGRRALLALWRGGLDGEVLSELDENLRDEVVATLAPTELAQAVADLESDDVVDIVETLDEDRQEAVLTALPARERVAVEKALAYPEHSAGRLMQVEVVCAPEHWTVGEAIDHLRGAGEALPDQFYHVVLVDPRMKPVGQVALGRILSARRDTRLRAIAEDSFRTFHVGDEEGEVARAFNRYHLISAPVVDDDDRLVGVITIDDAMTVLDEEHAEEVLNLAGVSTDASLSDRILETSRKRLTWLAVNLATAILASLVIGLFEDELARVVALAVLMPIVASMGGNAGTQTLTVAVRALATRELTGSNTGRVILREAAVGAINGLTFALIMGVVAWLWFGDPVLGGVIALAMQLTLVAAAVAGVLIPIGLDRAGVDPAVASGPFVTTVTDVVGFFAFLGLAAVILP